MFFIYWTSTLWQVIFINFNIIICITNRWDCHCFFIKILNFLTLFVYIFYDILSTIAYIVENEWNAEYLSQTFRDCVIYTFWYINMTEVTSSYGTFLDFVAFFKNYKFKNEPIMVTSGMLLSKIWVTFIVTLCSPSLCFCNFQKRANTERKFMV